MSLSKSLKLLFYLSLIFLGSFFVIKNVKAVEIEPPIILDSYQILDENKAKIVVSGLTTSLTGCQVSVLIYINQKYYNLANVSKTSSEFCSFYYESPWIEKENNFEVMAIARDKKTGWLSPPSILAINSIRKSNDTFKIALDLTENDENLVLSAPTLISPNLNDAIGKIKPLILGLTNSGTLIHVYIDDIYNGKTKVLNHPSGVANFAYMPFLNLSIGKHQVWVVAEDKSGQKSQKSDILEFIVEHPMPAPTMLTPLKNITNLEPVFISGLAKNNSLIKVFVDHGLENEFLVKNHSSGVANFAYSSKKVLKRGSHLVYATATDNRGKESMWSNILYFVKYEPKITATTAAKSLEPEKTTSASITVEKIVENPTPTAKEIRGISEEKSILSTLEKNSEKNNNFRLNLAIFIIFLIGIIIWMLLVNKELIKENKDKENKQDFNEKNDFFEKK